MRDILTDVVRQTAGLFEEIKFIGTSTDTVIQAAEESMTMFLVARTKEPCVEAIGEFGMSNLGRLNGLLNFASYKTDNAKLEVKRGMHNGKETVEQFSFRDANGAGSNFRTKDASTIEAQTVTVAIPWQFSFTPDKGRLAEFIQLASLFKDVEDKYFGTKTKNGSLYFSIGEETDSTDNADMVFESDVIGDVNLKFNISHFVSVMKLCGNNPTTMKFMNRGVMGITIETPVAFYDYYLRAPKA